MKDFKWIINRLKSMNTPEIVWRIQQKALQKSEFKKYYIYHLPVTEITLETALEQLRPNIEKIGLNWNNDNYHLFEKLDIFGIYDYKEYKKQWNAGFQTGKSWPINDFSHLIATSQRDDIGDIRTNWELNRHYQFVGLAKNYFITSDERYIDEFKELFISWNKNNLFLHGVQWTSVMEVSIRLISWTYSYCFLERAFQNRESSRESELLDQISHGIKVMADYIVNHRARYSSANNHLIVEMLGVGVAGILFNYGEWIEQSVIILTEELQKQNFIDGVNKEMSLHYQSFVMEAYGIMWLLLKKNNITVSQLWNQHLTQMSLFLATCCGDYGEVVVFGDNDEGKILNFSGEIADHYRYVLQLMGILLDHKYTEADIIENVYWITDKTSIWEYSRKQLYKPKLVQSYKMGGYTILRSRDHKVLIGFDHAELGFGSIAAHGHADALSLQVFYEGEPILVDSGTYNYHVPKTVRDMVRKTAAHNTVFVDGYEQADMLGPFLWGRRYKKQFIDFNLSNSFVEISASIIYRKIHHTRKIRFDMDRTINVIDTVCGSKDSKQIWHFSSSDVDKVELISSSERIHTSKYEYSDAYAKICTADMIIIDFQDYLETIIKVR